MLSEQRTGAANAPVRASAAPVAWNPFFSAKAENASTSVAETRSRRIGARLPSTGNTYDHKIRIYREQQVYAQFKILQVARAKTHHRHLGLWR